MSSLFSRPVSSRELRHQRSRYRAALFNQLESRTLLAASPFGVVQTFTASGISGYAYDTDTPATAVHVQVIVDGVLAVEGDATIDLPEIVNKTQGTGTAHGFSFPLTLPVGSHSVQVIALDTETAGVTKTLKSGKIKNNAPVGGFSTFSNTQVIGFATDRDSSATALSVQIRVDGVVNQTLTADQAKPLGAKGGGPGSSGNHWFTANLSGLSDGPHLIEIWAADALTGEFVRVAGKTTPNNKPQGILEVVNSTTISGVAWDPDSHSAVEIILQVDKTRTNIGTASLARPDVGTLPDPNHGFSIVTPTHLFGTHTVKIIAKDTFSGAETVIGTKTFRNNAPKGKVELINATTVRGYTFDPDSPSTTLEVLLRIDGVVVSRSTAGVNRPDLVTSRKIVNPPHGFDLTLNGLTAGRHKIDVFGVDPVTGVTALIGSKTITVL